MVNARKIIMVLSILLPVSCHHNIPTEKSLKEKINELSTVLKNKDSKSYIKMLSKREKKSTTTATIKESFKKYPDEIGETAKMLSHPVDLQITGIYYCRDGSQIEWSLEKGRWKIKDFSGGAGSTLTPAEVCLRFASKIRRVISTVKSSRYLSESLKKTITRQLSNFIQDIENMDNRAIVYFNDKTGAYINLKSGTKIEMKKTERGWKISRIIPSPFKTF